MATPVGTWRSERRPLAARAASATCDRAGEKERRQRKHGVRWWEEGHAAAEWLRPPSPAPFSAASQEAQQSETPPRRERLGPAARAWPGCRRRSLAMDLVRLRMRARESPPQTEEKLAPKPAGRVMLAATTRSAARVGEQDR